MRVSGIAPQLMGTKGWFARGLCRWMWLAKCPLPTPVSPVIKIVQWRCAARSASCSHKGTDFESCDSLEGDLGLPKPGAGGLLAMSFSLFPPLSADGTTVGISIPNGQATNRERAFPSSLAHTQHSGCVSHGKRARTSKWASMNVGFLSPSAPRMSGQH